MATLILLHAPDGKEIHINPDFIASAETTSSGGTNLFAHCFNVPLVVTESIEEIKALMEGQE